VAAAPALSSAWDRLSGPARLGGVDLARGLAVVGMVAAHVLTIAPFDPADPGGTWIDVVNGRSSILFATLAGVSIGLVTGGPRPIAGPARRDARLRLAFRAALLWIVGVLLIMTGVPVYVILPAYGILFLLSLPLLGLRARALLLLAAGLALVMPLVQPALDALPTWEGDGGELLAAALGWHYPFTTWIAFLAAGMGLGRLELRRASVQAVLLLVGAGLAAMAYATAALTGRAPFEGGYWSSVWTADAHSSGLLEVVGSGAFAIAVVALCLLLCRTFATWIVLPLRAVGSMPLTAYTVQILVWAVWALAALGTTEDLAAFRALDPFWPLTIALLVACTAWALLLGRGPLERLVDRLTRLSPRPAA